MAKMTLTIPPTDILSISVEHKDWRSPVSVRLGGDVKVVVSYADGAYQYVIRNPEFIANVVDMEKL